MRRHGATSNTSITIDEYNYNYYDDNSGYVGNLTDARDMQREKRRMQIEDKEDLEGLEDYFIGEEVIEEIIEDKKNVFRPEEMSEIEKQLFLSDHFDSNLFKNDK